MLNREVHGSLQVSNNLPLRMEIRLADKALPYEAIEYAYATPADSLAGYPAEFVIFYKSRDGLKPLTKVEFKSVLLATQQLSSSHFDEARFADRIKYTNVFSNADFYANQTKGNRLTKVNSYVTSGGFSNSHSRKVIYILFTVVTLFPVVFLSIWSVRNKNK